MDKPPSRIRSVRLPNDPFLQSNGYKPAPLDLSMVSLTTKLEELVEQLAENTHNIWARERILQGWTYGLNEDPDLNRLAPEPQLVSTEIKEGWNPNLNRLAHGLQQVSTKSSTG